MCTARPENLDTVDAFGRTETHEEPRIIGRKVATPSFELAVNDPAAGVNFNNSADRGTVRPLAQKLQADPRSTRRFVVKNRGMSVHDADDRVDGAVVVEIAEGRATRNVTRGEKRAGVLNQAESTVP